RWLWLRKLLDGVAHRCVRQSRRDPRESGETDQSVFEQLSRLIEGPTPTLAQLRVQGPGWYHHMTLPGEDLVAFVAPLLRQARAELLSLRSARTQMGARAGAVMTAAAAGLPGLASALQARLSAVVAPPQGAGEDDLGDLLVSQPASGPVQVLPV